MNNSNYYSSYEHFSDPLKGWLDYLDFEIDIYNKAALILLGLFIVRLFIALVIQSKRTGNSGFGAGDLIMVAFTLYWKQRADLSNWLRLIGNIVNFLIIVALIPVLSMMILTSEVMISRIFGFSLIVLILTLYCRYIFKYR